MSAYLSMIDAFVDKVTVNAEKQIVHRSRLCLVNRIREAMRQVAV